MGRTAYRRRRYGPKDASEGGHVTHLDPTSPSGDSAAARRGGERLESAPQLLEVRRNVMHARLTSLSGSPDEVDAGIADFREKVVPFTHEQGGKGGILLVDRQSGEAIAITLWEDEQALRASEERANELRAAVAEEMRASEQPSVSRYEVAVFET